MDDDNIQTTESSVQEPIEPNLSNTDSLQSEGKKVKQKKVTSKKKGKGRPTKVALPKIERRWFKIDNAGLIYMPASNRNWTAVFRVSCVLKDEVDPEILQQAVNDLTPRFPTLMVHIRAGLFWYYLETAPRPPKIIRESLYPCRNFELKSKQFAVRVLYYHKRIAFESFHAITDGGGAMKYLISLVRRYLQIKTGEHFDTTGCLDYKDLPTDEETEDSFMRYAKIGEGRKYAEKKSLQLEFEKDDPNVFNIMHGQFSLREMKELTRTYNCTIGQFITACIFYAMYTEIHSMASMPPGKAPLKIAVPIDLRRKYPSESIRNFSSYMNMELDHTVEQTFEEILASTKKQFESIDDKYLHSSISANVTKAMHPLVRIMPLFMKNIALSVAYKIYGEKLSASAFSNLGPVKTPEGFSNYCERFEFFLGPPKVNAIACSGVCYRDNLVITISSRCRNTNIEKRFFQHLISLGLNVCVDTNRRPFN